MYTILVSLVKILQGLLIQEKDLGVIFTSVIYLKSGSLILRKPSQSLKPCHF